MNYKKINYSTEELNTLLTLTDNSNYVNVEN